MTLAFYNFVPFCFILALYALKPRLQDHNIEKRIGSLYVGLQTDKVWSHLSAIVFMWRRSLFVLIAFTMLDHPGLQVQLLAVSAMANLMFVLHGVQYFERSQLCVEVINELAYLAICYAFMINNLSGQLEPETR